MLNEDIIVQKSVLPFRQNFETLRLQDCKTPQEIVNKLVPFNFVNCKLVVTLDGEILSKDKWNQKLKKGQIVSLNYVPTGGDDGKAVMQVVITIAAIVATAYLGPIAGGAIAAGNYGTAALAGAGIVAVSMVSSMAMNALMTTPKQSDGTLGYKDSQTQFIEGASNSINKFGVIPVNLGTNRMFPPQAALPYTETSGNDQYCRQLFTYGYGKVTVIERKLGETILDDYDYVEVEDKLNADLNSGTSLYANDIYQEDFSIKVTKEESPFIRTTQKDCDECILDFTFQGLVNGITQGKYAGLKLKTSVQFEIQFAPINTEDWSTSINGATIQEQSINADISVYLLYRFLNTWVCRRYFLALNTQTGDISIHSVDSKVNRLEYPSLSSEYVYLGYYENGSFHDLRQNLVGSSIESIDNFIVTTDVSDKSNALITVGSGNILGSTSMMTVTDATSRVLRVSRRIVFPARGQYQIKVNRLTDDSNIDSLLNDSYWTALKSITYRNPVNFPNISGTAMRIKATDQLNGTVNSYNAIVSTLMKSYNPDKDLWVDDVATSNPADIFRYVLQSPAFAKYEQITDDKIDLEKLKEWWIYCNSLNLTFNKVIDSDTSIDDVLNDICAAGVATLSKVDNVFSVIIDNERPYVKGLVTPRNSWDYKGNINYPELPDALRVEFRNAEIGYSTDERIVYMDGFDENNAKLFERLEFSSCTNADLAYWYGRRYFATALLQPETHTFKMDFEHLTFNRGDRINLVNDVILVGVGQGRIKELVIDDEDNITGFVIDDKVNIPSTKNFAVRIRDNNAKGFSYHLLKQFTGTTDTFTFAQSLPAETPLAIGSLCAFVEDGKELDLIITQIKTATNETATITAVDYAPARFTPIEEFPEWSSNITIPGDFYKPYAPELNGEIQSDESVMIRNSDGSLTSVMIIPLKNINESSVIPVIQMRITGATEWFVPNTLKNDSNELVLTGLSDGSYYDISIRYQRQTGLQLLSDALFINNVKFIGGSTPPKDVKNFRVTVTNGLALFEWTPNDDIDISHYVIKYSLDTKDVSWESAQTAVARVTSNTVTMVIHRGMYLIKAVDLLGFESKNATAIISVDSGAYKNVVEELIQHPNWEGRKENTYAGGGILTLSPEKSQGYYYFNPEPLDLGEVYECSLTADVKSNAGNRSRVRDIVSVRSVESIRNFNLYYQIRTVENIRALEEIRTFSSANWEVRLEMNLSDDNENWTGWQQFSASQHVFRYCKFRIFLFIDNLFFAPNVLKATVTIDMPDRYESGEDVEITNANAGSTITYENAFWNNPSVNVTIQDGAVDDRVEFINKDNKGFTVRIFNATLNSYVTRSFDYISAGYGKVV
jgi:hypothetical protein